MKLLLIAFLSYLLNISAGRTVPVDYGSSDGENVEQNPLIPAETEEEIVKTPSNYEDSYQEEQITINTAPLEDLISGTLPPMIIANKFRVKQDDINNAVTEFQKMLSSLMSSVRGEFSGLKDRMDERFKGFMHRSNEIFYDLRTSLGNMFEGLRRSTSSH